MILCFLTHLCISFHCRLAGLTCVLNRLEGDSADIHEEPSPQARRIEIEETGLDSSLIKSA